MNRLVLSSMLLSGAVVACDEGAPESEYTGPAIEIAVAPLDLPGITNATYRILIENSAPNSVSGNDVTNGTTGANNVVYLPGISSTNYGNGAGGDISYVAPCDASVTADLDGSATGTQNAVVTMWVESLTPNTGFVNPCPLAGTGCRIFTSCGENADTFVEFNLTIMREADQGFFDVAVNFEDVFCSGKLDSQYSPGNPILLLHGSDSERDQTAVSALACTHGASTTVTTTLWRNNPVVQCTTASATDCTTLPDETACTTAGCTWTADPAGCSGTATPTPTATFTLDLALAEGNQEATNTLAGATNTETLRYAIYKGSETIQSNNVNAQKKYWNYAINLGELAADYPTSTCSLVEHRATAVANNAAACTTYTTESTCGAALGCSWNGTACSGTAVGAFPAFGAGVYTSWPFVVIGGGSGASATVLTTARSGATGPGTANSFNYKMNDSGSKVTTTYVTSGNEIGRAHV